MPTIKGKKGGPLRPGARAASPEPKTDTIEGHSKRMFAAEQFGVRFLHELDSVLKARGDERETAAWEFRKKYSLDPREIDLSLEFAIAERLSVRGLGRSELMLDFGAARFLKRFGIDSHAPSDAIRLSEMLEGVYDGRAFSYAEKALFGNPMEDFVERIDERRPFGSAPARSNIYVSGIRASFASKTLQSLLKSVSEIISEMELRPFGQAYEVPGEAYLSLFDARGVSWANNIGGRSLGDAKLSYYFNEFPRFLAEEIAQSTRHEDESGAASSRARPFVAASGVGTNGDDDLAALSFGGSFLHHAIASAMRRAAQGASAFLEQYVSGSQRRFGPLTKSHALGTFFNANAAYSPVELLGKDSSGVIAEMQGKLASLKSVLEPRAEHAGALVPVRDDVSDSLARASRSGLAKFDEMASSRSDAAFLLYVYPVFGFSGVAKGRFSCASRARGRWHVAGNYGCAPLKSLNYVLGHDEVSQVVVDIIERVGNGVGLRRLGSSGFVFAYGTKKECEAAAARLSEPGFGGYGEGLSIRYHYAMLRRGKGEDAVEKSFEMSEAVTTGRLLSSLDGSCITSGQAIRHPCGSPSAIATPLYIFLARLANFCKRNLGKSGAGPGIGRVSFVFKGEGEIVIEPEGCSGAPGATQGQDEADGIRVEAGVYSGDLVQFSAPPVKDEFMERFIALLQEKYGFRLPGTLAVFPTNCDPYEVAIILQQWMAFKKQDNRIPELAADLASAAKEYAIRLSKP